MKISVFLIARRIVELATNVTTPNNKLRIQVRMFVTKSSSALSKLMPLKYKQAFPVLFMSEERIMQNTKYTDYKKESAIRIEEKLLSTGCHT